MSLERVDELIKSWEARLQRIDDNLIVLEGDSAYQLLAAAKKRGSLTGVTASRVVPALDAVAELFEERQRLGDVLARAKAVRETVSFWDRDGKVREIDQLLNGKSIAMGSTSTPLSKRKLLGDADHDVLVEPEALLAHMIEEFERARDAVIAVGRTWDALDAAMRDVEAELARLAAAAHEIGRTSPELANVARDFEAFRDRLGRDPLGLQADFATSLKPRLAAIQQQVDGEIDMRSRVRSGLARAQTMLRDLESKQAAATRARAVAVREIAGADAELDAPLTPDSIEALNPWLEKIASVERGGRWAAADVGIGRWLEAAEGYVAKLSQELASTHQILERRVELTGRLSARKAQLSALAARGGGPFSAIEARIREAEKALAHVPTNVAEAAKIVDEVDASVAAVGKKTR